MANKKENDTKKIDKDKTIDLDKETNKDVEDDLEKTKVLDEVTSLVDEDKSDTKEVEKIEDIVVEEEKKEEVLKSDDNNEMYDILEKKDSKNKGRNAITIILIIIICILFVALLFVLNKDRKEDDKTLDKDITDVTLTEDDKITMINNYGKALESVIMLGYQRNQVILTFEEANELVELEDDVSCNIHEVYDDGKVYLDNCAVNGKMTEYSYGEKQEPKEPFDSGTMFKVYVNKTTNERTLVEPNNLEQFDEYTVHCGDVFENPIVLGFSDYVAYFDKDYNVQMKNFKIDTKVLSNINYTSIMPFKISDNYYDLTYVAVSNGTKWSIYNLETSKVVVGYIYDYFTTLSMGVTGPMTSISTLKDKSVAVSKNGKYGVIDYTSGVEIIPVVHDSLIRSGNYLWAREDNGNLNYIYDFSGNNYLADKYDKLYGIAGGTYVLVSEDDEIKLVQMDGKVLYKYGKAPNLGRLNFALDYNNGAIFQFYKEDPTELSMCVEYTYNPSTKKGETKDIECGGIAKPILYLYPEEETDVTVSFSNPEILDTTYPKFNNYWRVTASPNGDLLDKDNKYYYALYWDEKKVHTVDFSEGFYVEKNNAIEFLEEKLSYIGLNDKERNEFIMYWLPILEKNEKSLVYFELTEERESYNKLLINPEPDSMLRLVIHIKKVDERTNIKKQTLTKFVRRGFSVVEWGGTTY